MFTDILAKQQKFALENEREWRPPEEGIHLKEREEEEKGRMLGEENHQKEREEEEEGRKQDKERRVKK